MAKVQLFYKGFDSFECFKQILNSLNEKKSKSELSLQEQHLEIILNFFHNDNFNPIPNLQKLSNIIFSTATSEDNWPINSTYGLIQYHMCIFYYYFRNFQECLKILDNLWKRIRIYDNILQLCISLLTIEICIASQTEDNLQAAKELIETKFLNRKDDLCSFLKGKGFSESLINSILTRINISNQRITALQSTLHHATETLECIIKNPIDSSSHSNSDYDLVYNVLPLMNAALSLNSVNKYESFLNIFPQNQNQTHFVISNGRGIYELMNKRYSTALLHFSKALNSRRDQNLNHPYEQIIYNVGLSLLMKRKPRKAFKYLYSLIPVMSNTPYLWLRLAECCVMYFKNRVQKLRRNQLSPVIFKKFSTPTRSNTILPTSDAKLFSRFPKETNPKTSFPGENNMTLEFAEKCASKAFVLSENNQQLHFNALLLHLYIFLELGDINRAVELSNANQWLPNDTFYQIYSSHAYYLKGDSKIAGEKVSKLVLTSSFNSLPKENLLMIYQTAARVNQSNQDVTKYLNKASEQDSRSPDVVLTKVAFELQNRRNNNEALNLLNSYGEKE